MKSLALLSFILPALASTLSSFSPTIHIYEAKYYNNREQLDYRAINVTHLLPKSHPVTSFIASTPDNWVQYILGDWSVPRFGTVTWAFEFKFEEGKKKGKRMRKRLDRICVEGSLKGKATLGPNLNAEYSFVIDGPWDDSRYVDSKTIVGTNTVTKFSTKVDSCIPVAEMLAGKVCEGGVGEFSININANLAVKELVKEEEMRPGTVGRVDVGGGARWSFKPVWADC